MRVWLREVPQMTPDEAADHVAQMGKVMIMIAAVYHE